jgi:hypothetical protein
LRGGDENEAGAEPDIHAATRNLHVARTQMQFE